MKKIFFILLLLIFHSLVITEKSTQATTEYIVIKSVGDVMLGTTTETLKNMSHITEIAKYLQDADIVMCNLEGVFIKEGMLPTKTKLGKKTCYVFGMPTALVEILKILNFNIVCLNNNHVMDYGQDGYEYTQELLKKLNIYCATKEEFVKLEIKNTKIAIVSFSFVLGTKFSILKIQQATNIIKNLKQDHNIVVVSFHGGAEGEQAMFTKNQTEYFLGENRGNVVEFAHAVIDAGADLVIGHGPHVLRAVEVYKGKLIAYSLGNFFTYRGFNLEGKRKYGGILEVQLSLNGELIKANFIPTLQLPPGIPVYDTKRTAIDILNSLGEMDFPNSYYKFD